MRIPLNLCRRLIILCTSFVLVREASAAPPPLANDTQPTFSACVEKVGAESSTSRRHWVDRPSGDQVQTLYYDVPFAVNVPVQVRHEGGIVRVSYRVTVDWERPWPKEWSDSPENIRSVDLGLYRADKKELPAGTVLYDDYGSDTDAKRWDKLILDTEAPIPTWTYPWKFDNPDYTRGGSLTIEAVKTLQSAHTPFARGATRNSFMLAPAQAGGYFFWFAIDRGGDWPQKEPKREELRGKFHIDVLVSRGERAVSDEETAYLFGRGPRPKDMPEDAFFRASTFTMPFVLKRNAWVFHHSEARPMDKSVQLPKTTFKKYKGETNTEVSSVASAGGAVVNLSMQTETWDGAVRGTDSKGKAIEVVYQENNSWTVTLPQTIPDNGFAEATVAGGQDKTYNLKHWRFKGKTYEEVDDTAHPDFFSINWVPDGESDIEKDVYGRVWHIRHTEEEEDRVSDAGARENFVKDYGPDAAPYWFDDYRPRTDIGQKAGGGPFRYLVRGNPFDDDEPKHRRYTIGEGGSYPAIAFNVGPWRVIGYYRREGYAPTRGGGATPSLADVPVLTSPDDGYFIWQPEFRKETSEMRQKIAEINLKLRALAHEKRRLRTQWRELWRIDVRSFPKMEESGGLADILFRFGKDVAYGGRETIPLQPTLSKEALLVLQTERRAIDDKIQQDRAEQERLLQEADQAVNHLVVSAQVQAPKTEEGRRKPVWDAVDQYQNYQRIVKVELMEAAEWFEAQSLQKAINDLQFVTSAQPGLAAYMQGLYWEARAREYDERFHNQLISPTPPPPNSDVEKMARRAWLEALMEYRRALDLNPTHAAARQKRAMIEVKFVQMIAGKLDAERRLTLERFESFLSTRGYGAQAPTNWSQSICEAGSVFLFSFPSTIAHGLPVAFWVSDIPTSEQTSPTFRSTVDLMADTMNMEATTAARNQVSLIAIRRLLEKRMKLEDIRQITPALYEQYVPLKAWSQERLPAERAEQCCRDLRETFADLADLQALAGRDRKKIEEMLDRTYFMAYATEQNWTEFLGNIFISPLSVVVAAPSATLRGGQTLGGVLKLNKVSAGLQASRLGPLVQEYATAYSQLGYVGAGANILAGTLAMAVVTGGAAEIASQNDLHMLSLFIQALAALSLERFAYNAIAESGLPPGKLANALEEMAGVVSRKKGELAEAGDVIKALQQIQKRLAGAPPAARLLTEVERKELQGVLRKVGGVTVHIPGDNPEADLQMALSEALKKLEAGDMEGAMRALEAARKAQAEFADELTSMSQDITAAHNSLSKLPSLPPPLTDYDPGPYQMVKDQLPSTPKAPGGTYPSDKFGTAMQAGDEAFKRGDFAGAAQEYSTALQWAQQEKANAMKNMLGPRLNRAQRAEQCAAHIQKFRKFQVRVSSKQVGGKAQPTAPITTAQFAELESRIKAGQYTIPDNPGKSPLFILSDSEGNRYVLKIIDAAEKDMPAANMEIQDELGAFALANLLGSKVTDPHSIRSPGAARVSIPDKKFRHTYRDGSQKDLPYVGIISRFVEHKEYHKLTEAEVLALRKDYALQRVFRLWIGDCDGHLRNHLRSAEGSTFAIDFGYAEFTKQKRIRLATDEDHKVRAFKTDEEHLRNLMAFPAFLRRSPKASLYHSIDAMDEFVSFADMSEAVDVIERLCKTDRAELERVVSQFFGPDRKDEVMQVLTDRADGRLREVIRRRFDPTHPNYKPTVLRLSPEWTRGIVLIIPPSALPSLLNHAPSSLLALAA